MAVEAVTVVLVDQVKAVRVRTVALVLTRMEVPVAVVRQAVEVVTAMDRTEVHLHQPVLKLLHQLAPVATAKYCIVLLIKLLITCIVIVRRNFDGHIDCTFRLS